AGPGQRGFDDGVGLAGQRNHRAVVVGVHLPVEDPDPRDLAHGVDQRVDFAGVAAFAEIRNTLDQSFHEEITAASNEILISRPRWTSRSQPDAVLLTPSVSRAYESLHHASW